MNWVGKANTQGFSHDPELAVQPEVDGSFLIAVGETCIDSVCVAGAPQAGGWSRQYYGCLTP